MPCRPDFSSVMRARVSLPAGGWRVVELVALRQVAPRRAAPGMHRDPSSSNRPLNVDLFCRSATKPTSAPNSSAAVSASSFKMRSDPDFDRRLSASIGKTKARELSPWPVHRRAKVKLLLERTNVCDQCFDLVIAQLVLEPIHLGLATLFLALFGDLNHVLVFHGGLDFGVGVIFHVELFAHLRVPFAVRTMTGRAVFLPVLLHFARSERSRHNDDATEDQ